MIGLRIFIDTVELVLKQHNGYESVNSYEGHQNQHCSMSPCQQNSNFTKAHLFQMLK